MKITVSKAGLLTKLIENRDKHREVFEDALDGYYAEIIKALESQMQRVRNKKKPDLLFPYRIPRDHTGDYDRVIGMLGMHQGDSFDLTEAEYAQYVDDNWGWSGEWRNNAKNFSASSSGKFAQIYGDDDDD